MMDNFDKKQEQYFQNVNKKQFEWLTGNPYIFAREKALLSEILKENPKRLLEVGCGEGANLVNLRKLGLRGNLTGVDYSQAKIDFAKQHAPFARFFAANAYSLPFEDCQFDLVLAKNLFHHLTCKTRVLREMTRVCASGGKVVIVEPNGKNLVVIGFAHLFEHERAVIHSSRENLLDLVFQEKLLETEEILMKEPTLFYRLLCHYRYGLSSLACLSRLWLACDRLWSVLVPQRYYGFIMIKAKKLTKPRPIFSLRSYREMVHSRQLFQRKKLLWWTTEAAKIRMSRRAKLLLQFIKAKEKVLEIGCGAGEFSFYLAKTGAKIIGIEITSEIVKLAKKEVKAKNISFQQGDIHHLPFAPSSFDSVVGNSILHHLNLPVALSEIRRVLKKDGKIIFFEPNLLNPHVFLQRKIGFFRRISRVSPDETAFSRWFLKNCLEKAGFKRVEVKPFDFLHPSTPGILIKMVKKTEPFLEKLPILKEFSGSLFIYGELK